ncbi:hypothetical protein FE257_006401 [Aspergillus nanangensis]|uniref:Secreted protein n=1 Tax=Aspergillus nanangensis TaxID=2582783 RepID=A0AAD4CXV2_ASPNN|nr:hypothetical protein FE257_006401 [Aspergillus nanangensis]
MLWSIAFILLPLGQAQASSVIAYDRNGPSELLEDQCTPEDNLKSLNITGSFGCRLYSSRNCSGGPKCIVNESQEDLYATEHKCHGIWSVLCLSKENVSLAKVCYNEDA